jgi:hypothetical protein
MTKSRSHTPDVLRLPPAVPTQTSCATIFPGPHATTAITPDRSALPRSQGSGTLILHDMHRASRTSDPAAASTTSTLSP